MSGLTKVIACVGAVVAVGALAAATVLHHEADAIAEQFVFPNATATAAAVVMPSTITSRLETLGEEDKKVEMTRVDGAGHTKSWVVDLTPREGKTVLKVLAREQPVIDRTIADKITYPMNHSASSVPGRALYAGMTHMSFTSVPTIVVSPTIDTADPDNARVLRFRVPVSEVVATAAAAGDKADLNRSPVTYVVVPTAGLQPQLGAAQMTYEKRLWRALLLSGGASSVTFVSALGHHSASLVSTPVVPVPAQPPTPCAPICVRPNAHGATCTVPNSYFKFGTARLVNSAAMAKALTPCVKKALTNNATFRIDGYASFEGKLTPAGKPTVNDPVNRTLSLARAKAIAELLITRMHVPASRITAVVGHGNEHQPYPKDPRSSRNRVVTVTYVVAHKR